MGSGVGVPVPEGDGEAVGDILEYAPSHGLNDQGTSVNPGCAWFANALAKNFAHIGAQ